jgi:hypothetical protein
MIPGYSSGCLECPWLSILPAWCEYADLHLRLNASLSSVEPSASNLAAWKTNGIVAGRAGGGFVVA